MFNFHPEAGKLSCVQTPFTAGEIVFEFQEFTFRSSELSWKKQGQDWISKSGKCHIRLQINYGVLLLSLTNQSRQNLFLKEIQYLFPPELQDSPLYAADYLEFIHGMVFGEPCGVKKAGLPAPAIRDNAPESSMVYVLHKRESLESYLFSTLPPHNGDYVSFKAVHDSPHCEGNFGLRILSRQQRLLKPGDCAKVSPVQCRVGNNPLELLQELGTQWKGSRQFPLKDIICGWNSWDYYAGAVTSNDLYDNQRQAEKLFPGKVKYIVIDEGYEPRWGDWTANWKFPEGLAEYCRKIKVAGGLPGLWTAPLMVNSYTQLYRHHPDWFGKTADGENHSQLLSYGPMASLDVTHPEARQWLFEVFRKLRQAGFELFKVDFCQMILECNHFHDRTVPRGRIIRIAFETIREAIGQDAYLLACGAPFESVTGIVDAFRISGDIHTYWGHVLRNAAEFSTRWWMHRNLWNNDPDFLIVRGSDTTDDPNMNRKTIERPFAYPPEGWLSGKIWNLNEAQVYALLVFLTGGDIVLGDCLEKLNSQGITLLKKILDNPLKTAAVPLDLFEQHGQLPRLWLAQEDNRACLGAFNWSEDPERVAFDLNTLDLQGFSVVKDFWTDREIVPKGSPIELNLPPRSCRGFVFTK